MSKLKSMLASKYLNMDGNQAAATIAHQCNEIIAIYPITPASPMGEWADEWSTHGQKNLWGTVPEVIEMQSEGGAAGAIHIAARSLASCQALSIFGDHSDVMSARMPGFAMIASNSPQEVLA